MSGQVRSCVYFSEVCRSHLLQFLDEVSLMRLTVGDNKQSITFGVCPDLKSVEFRYHGKSVHLPCLSPYKFPDTERDLADIVGDSIRNIRLTGRALSASSNAMAMISGDYEDIVRLSSYCRFQSGEKAVFTFPVLFNWSTAELIRETYSKAPFEIRKLTLERHRFILLEKFHQQLYGDWVLCVLDSPPNADQSGSWTLTFPGGKRLLGETSLQCCLREIHEEIGLVGDLESLERTDDLACVSLDGKFCSFILHPNHFSVPQVSS